jgi:general secretion pathway protein L
MISVGIDIGTYSIKVAEIEPTSKSYVIRRVQEFPLSLDPSKDKKIEIIDTLRTLFMQYDLDHTQFIFAVPQRFVSARLLNFPFRERFKVQKAMVSQLEDELPLSQEDAIFDAKIVRYIGKGADVLAMAVPRERVSDIVELAHDCGVSPILISAESLGLSNLFERWDQTPPEVPALAQDLPAARPAELIVDIGHTSTQMLVYAEGMLLGARTIDWGAKNIADALGLKYGLNYLQAIKELQSKGFVLLDKSQGTREQVAFSQVIEGSLQILIADMRLKLMELETELHLQWTKGLLMGGGAQLKNVSGYLTQHFQIQFNKYKQFDHHPTASFEFSTHLELASGSAVGLALEGLKRPRNPATNFLKGEFARQGHVFEALLDKWGYTARVVAAAFVIFVVYGLIRESLALSLLDASDQALRKQAEAIAKVKGSQASPSRLRKFIAQQEKLAKGRQQAEKVIKINSALDVLDQITAGMPNREALQLEIKRLSIDAETAEIHGYSGNKASVEQIQKSLQRASANGKAEPIQLRITVPEGKTGFAFRFPINRFSGG